MNRHQLWNSYRQISAQTASPGQLVLMLYDGALRFLEKSLGGFGMEDPIEFNQTISNNVIRAQAIIGELNSTLNMQQGGQLAYTLRRLYVYMDDRLMESNLRKSPEGIRDTIRRLTILRDAWQEMLHQRTTESARETETESLFACG
jgi:flagellar protein FliS